MIDHFYALVYTRDHSAWSNEIPFTDQQACTAFMVLRRSQGYEVRVWYYIRDAFGGSHSTDQLWEGSWR